MNLQRHIQVLAVFQQICPIFHNTCWILFSRQGCLNERPGCRVDFATEFLNCLRSIQRRSIMSIRSPRKSPTYKLRFQPQPSAKGSEVDATRNFLGAGMGLGSNPPSPAPPKMPFPYTQGLDRCPVAVGAIVEAGIQEVYVIQFPSVPMVLSSNQWSRPVERASTVFELSILLRWNGGNLFCSCAPLPLCCQTPRTKAASQFIICERGREQEMALMALAAFPSLSLGKKIKPPK